MPQMSRDLTMLMIRRQIFSDLKEVSKENSQVLNPGDFFDWMCENYIEAMAVGIRAFIDQSQKVQSVWRMLYEFLDHPKAVTRSAHVALYRGISRNFDMGNQTFDNIVGQGKDFLSQQVVRSDLRRLEDASERVRRFVNKRIAHRTPSGAIRRLPKFQEIEQALDELEIVFLKYNRLLTASGPDSLNTCTQYDWREVLWTPWIPPGSPLRPET